jgi:hypothetical protein
MDREVDMDFNNLISDIPIKEVVEKPELKLYIWDDFATGYSYYPSFAFAIAISEEEAKKLVIAENNGMPIRWGDVIAHNLNEPIARAIEGGD